MKSTKCSKDGKEVYVEFLNGDNLCPNGYWQVKDEHVHVWHCEGHTEERDERWTCPECGTKNSSAVCCCEDMNQISAPQEWLNTKRLWRIILLKADSPIPFTAVDLKYNPEPSYWGGKIINEQLVESSYDNFQLHKDRMYWDYMHAQKVVETHDQVTGECIFTINGQEVARVHGSLRCLICQKIVSYCCDQCS